MSFKDKSPEMKAFLDKTSMDLFGHKTSDAINDRFCVMCNKKNLEFRDELSKKEFEISGICQECQDSIFGAEEKIDECS